MFQTIAFDGDDTLWHNKIHYTKATEGFKRLLASYGCSESIESSLYDTEVDNLRYYGYGVKSFTLSMIETAVGLTGGHILGDDVKRILDFAKEMLGAPVQLLDQAEETLAILAEAHTLMLITKGDLFDQEARLLQSGLADHFSYVEIVSEKARDVYDTLLANHGIPAQQFLMVGNSLRSDIYR